MSDAELVSSYVKYKTKRAQIKARQRAELEQELLPEAQTLGAVIVDHRAAGKRVQDIGFTIGLKNRSFIYKMIDTYNEIRDPKPKPEPEEVQISEEIESVKTLDKPYEIDYTESSAVVKVYLTTGSYTTTTISTYQGIIDFPDEWVNEPDRERRKLYSQIVREVTEHVTGK